MTGNAERMAARTAAGSLSLETDRQHAMKPWVAVLALVVLACVLRFWRLGDWSFQATEMFTLRDSLVLKVSNPRPLGYVLTHYLVGAFRPLDEFGLRLLPAIFGVLSIPALYLVGRPLVGTRAALLSALLLTVSPLHVMYSQLARYWSLVFLLSAIYPYALYLGIRDRNRGALALGLVTGVLAVLAHPVSVLLLGGPGLLLLAALRREHFARLWSQKTVRWIVVAALVLLAVIAMRFIPVFRNWIEVHDENPGYGQFLLRPNAAPGLKQVFYVMAFVESLTLPLVLSAFLGIYWLWQTRERPLAWFLASLAAFVIGFLALVSLRTAVSQYYLLPAAPVFFLGAGVFLDRLFTAECPLRPRWLLPAMLTVIIVAAGVPTLVSDARDGRRYDFRGGARWLAARLAPDDLVFSDQPMVLAHYLPQAQVHHLRQDLAPLDASVRALRQTGRGGALWLVAPAPSHAFRTNMRQGGLIDWIYENCQLRNNIGVGRVDLRQQYLHIYRCPPAVPDASSPDR
jgi:hypothetical protein